MSVCHSSLTSNTVHCYSLANGRQIVYEDRTRVPVVDKIHKDTFHPEELCTLEHGTTCQGDSGGPLFIEEYDDR